MAYILKHAGHNFLIIRCCTSRCFLACSLRYVKVRRNVHQCLWPFNRSSDTCMIGHVHQGWRIHVHSRHVYLPAPIVPGVRKEWWGFEGKFVEIVKTGSFGAKKNLWPLSGNVICYRFMD